MRSQLWIEDDEIYGNHNQAERESRRNLHTQEGEADQRSTIEGSTLLPSLVLPLSSSGPRLPSPPVPSRPPPSPPLFTTHRRHSPNQPSEPFPELGRFSAQVSQLNMYAALAHAPEMCPPSTFNDNDMFPEPELPQMQYDQHRSSSPMTTETSKDGCFSLSQFGHDGSATYSNSSTRAKSSDTTRTQWPSVLPETPPDVLGRHGRAQHSSSSYYSPSPPGAVSNCSSDRKTSNASRRTNAGTPNPRRMTMEEKMSEIDVYLGLDRNSGNTAASGKKIGRHAAVAATGRRVARSGISTVANAVHRAIERVDHMLAEKRASSSSSSAAGSGGNEARAKRGLR